MPKLTIEVDGLTSEHCKIFVDDKQIGLVQEIELKAKAKAKVNVLNDNNLEINATFPDFRDYELSEHSILHKVQKYKEALESCGVKCKLIEPPPTQTTEEKIDADQDCKILNWTWKIKN